MFCPVPGCPAGSSATHAGWASEQGRRPHLDAHLLGTLSGTLPASFLAANDWTACRECGRLCSRRCNGGVHRACLPRLLGAAGRAGGAEARESSGAAEDEEPLERLPGLEEVFRSRRQTRLELGEGLGELADRELLKCCAKVVAHNHPAAFDDLLDGDEAALAATELGPAGSEAARRSRRAWTELLMFSKTCLPALPGGRAKERRNRNLVATRLSRWAEGERAALWEEVREERGERPGRRGPAPGERRKREKGDAEEERTRRQEEAVDLARRGFPKKALQRLTGAGVAEDTPEVEAKMRSKFVTAPTGQAASRRPPAPPANELTTALVGRALAGFKRGAGPGASGMRPDHLLRLVGKRGQKPGATVVTELFNLIADGRAPRGIRRWLAGAEGHALGKEGKEPGLDCRPAAAGEALRRGVARALFLTEKGTLRDYLEPSGQLAVGVPAGVEVLPHATRAWLQERQSDPDAVLLCYDEGNAHNEVSRHRFLSRMQELTPGLSRFLEWAYPTDAAAEVVYRGRLIRSEAGGLQGCPLMAACHGVVQRALPETAGLVPVDPRTAPLGPQLAPSAELDLDPGFADDGVVGGGSAEMLRVLGHWRAVMPALGLRFSRLELVPAAGAATTVDLDRFRALGCEINLTQCVEIVKAPVAVGPNAAEFCQRFGEERAEKAAGVVKEIVELPDRHVALHLLRQSGDFCRMNYLARCAPSTEVSRGLELFDRKVRAGLERLAGGRLEEEGWRQAQLPGRKAGVGLRSATNAADAAYVASRAATHELCKGVRRGHAWDAGAGTDLGEALTRLRERIPDGPAQPPPTSVDEGEEGLAALRAEERRRGAEADRRLLQGEEPTRAERGTQQRLTRALEDKAYDKLKEEAESRADPEATRRLAAYAAPGAGRWLQAVPSRVIDMNLTNAELSTTLKLQFGVDIFEADGVCSFCGAVSDRKGVHARSCMCGGDQDARHNAQRDATHAFARRGNLRPQLEAVGLLAEPGAPDGRRPADTLVCAELGPPSVAERAGARPARKHALDFKVINPLGVTRGSREGGGARPEPLEAARAYAAAARERVAQRCEEAGIRYHAVVFEATGGVEDKEAAPVLHQIAQAVAAVEDREVSAVKQELLERLSMELVRSAARAVLRRTPKLRVGQEGAALAFLRREARLREPEEGPVAVE